MAHLKNTRASASTLLSYLLLLTLLLQPDHILAAPSPKKGAPYGQGSKYNSVQVNRSPTQPYATDCITSPTIAPGKAQKAVDFVKGLGDSSCGVKHSLLEHLGDMCQRIYSGDGASVWACYGGQDLSFKCSMLVGPLDGINSMCNGGGGVAPVNGTSASQPGDLYPQVSVELYPDLG